MPGLNLQGGFGAGGAVDQLRVLVAEAQRKQMEENRVAAQQSALDEEARQFNETQPIRLGQLGVAREHASADTRRAGVAEGGLALEQGAQPIRLDLLRAQTGDILRRPEAEAAEAERQRQRDETNQNYRIFLENLQNTHSLGQIGARGTEQRRTDAAAPRSPLSEPLVAVEMPDGTQQLLPRSQAANMKPAATRRPVLGTERQNLSYFNRAQEAAKVAEPLEGKFTNLASQARLQYAPNWLQSSEGQQYRQAQRAFTEARLRKESGAAIPTSEYENDAKTYWMQPGDSPEIIAQKKSARQEVLDGLAFSAGSAYQEFYGTPFERKAPSAGGTIGGGQKDGEERPIPGIPGGVAKLIGGKWIRIK